MTAVEEDAEPLSAKVAARIRTMLVEGRFAPGEKLYELEIATELEISRNTLREVFRLLTSQGLLTHIPNRGVFVAAPDEAMVMEPSSAVPVATILKNKDLFAGKRIGVIITGGNVDLDKLPWQ